MPSPLHLLLVEDNPHDAELVIRELRRAGFELVWHRVDTEGEYLAGLHAGLDLILSDFALPQFNGLRALELRNQRGLDIPFIIVSGTIGEETAVSAMKQGAADYLLKDRLTRLAPAVSRAIADAALRRERAGAAEALRESEARFRQVVENIHEVFWMSDVEKSRIIYISPGYEQVWGRKCEELYASMSSWVESIRPEDRDRVLQAAMTKQVSGAYDETYRIVRPDGAVRWIRDKAFPVRDKDGAVRRVVGVAEDITEQKNLEEHLMHAQRMEAIGTLASGVAHDLNNILAPILMVAGVLKESTTSAKDREILSMIERSGQRGAGIIRQLLSFSRGETGERVIVQPRHLVRDMAEIVRETFPRNIRLIETVAPDLWTIETDPAQLHQIVMNLFVNARDAMPAGGTLTIEADNQRVDAEKPAESGLKPGRYLRLTVRDTGHGIPAEIVSRVFEPFFTTKEKGKGTGLGLSMVVSIVKAHGGAVLVSSEPGHGTVFRVYLPASERSEGAGAVESSAPMPRGQQELILIVDDEAPIRDTTRSFLERQGYRVLVAGSGEEAVKLFIRHVDVLRLVLTDIMMPGMDGLALIRALRILDPDVRVIATSGLDQENNRGELTALGVTEILAKPFMPAVLLKALGAALGRESDPTLANPPAP